jgi:ribosome-associated protein
VEVSDLEPGELAKKAVEVASDKQALDIILLDIRGLSGFADYFVICSGETERQIRAISEGIDEVLGKEGASLHRREGTTDSGWILLDFGDVIVHVFAPRERQYYQLDKLWSKATPVVRIQ